MIASPAAREHFVEIPLLAGWDVSMNASESIPAQVPGTIASALRAAGKWKFGDDVRFDDSTCRFRCRFAAEPAEADEQILLRIEGIATLAEVTLNGEGILKTSSMFVAHEIDVTRLIREHNELQIECRPLSAELRNRRSAAPRARWRTRVVSEQNLRWFRTTLLGRAPGFSPEPEPAGPWRPISLLRRRTIALENWTRRVSLDGSTGIVAADLRFKMLGATPESGRLIVGSASAALDLETSGDVCRARAVVRLEDVARWWPHTHGTPALFDVRAELNLGDGSTVRFDDIPLGFCSIDPGADPPGDGGLALRINGSRVFCRGVVWTPPDVAALHSSPSVLRRRLELLRDAGFNLIRIAGTMTYESETFHRLCDELGLLVWQDMMFANMDYPFDDPEFHQTVLAEAHTELMRLSRYVSTAVICGNSEIEQQAGMLGMDQLGRGSFFGGELPRLAGEICPGIPYIPSAPCGGDQAFRTRAGVANYFGVGAYLRPLEDVRRAEVKFASECLAFANVPEPEMIDKIAAAERGGMSPIHSRWKRAAAHDAGTGWDFEDVRDHYLKLLYGVDAASIRYADISRYWELSRMVSGEVMAEVFGEWRRARSGCSGGIVLWSADLEPGAGWGILDSDGHPKAAYWFLKRALAPQAIWMTGEGLNGVDIHVANDRPEPLSALLRVALYRRGEHKIAESEIRITIQAATAATFGVEEVLGRFVDAAYCFRFGPPGHDLIVSSLHRDRGDVPFSQAFYFPLGRPADRLPVEDLGIACEGDSEILLSSRKFAYGVRVAAPGFSVDDAYFGIEPGGRRRVVLRPLQATVAPPKIAVTAVNAEGRLRL